MKTTLAILLALGAVVTIIAFTSPKLSTTEVSVFRDVTSQHLAQPDSGALLKFYDFSDNEWNGGIFRFTNITDVSANPVIEVSIDPANKWLSSLPQRNQNIQKFEGQVEQITTNAQQDTVGRWHSSIYLPIAREINRLSQSTANRRVLVVYSDLMENEPDFSFYSSSTFSLLQSNPEVVTKFFEQEQSLGQLNGIEVYFIYQPDSTLSDQQFNVVSGFYKNLLEAKGAKVTIEANLIL